MTLSQYIYANFTDKGFIWYLISQVCEAIITFIVFFIGYRIVKKLKQL